jgi:zinc protease
MHPHFTHSILLGLAMACVAIHSGSAQEPEGLPTPANPREMQFAEPQETTLGNGLRVIVVERPALPLLSVGVVVSSGAEGDPDRLSGLAGFTAGLLMRGTTSRSATQLAQDLEQLGASVQVEAGWDQTFALMTTLANNATAAMEILADVVRHPGFAPEEIERSRKESLDELRVALEQPGQLARVAAARTILGSSAYAHSANGTPAALQRIKRPDIAAAHARGFRPGNTSVIMVGDIKSADAFALAERLYGDWKAANPESEKPASASDSPKPSAVLIDMPTAGQAAVYVGNPGSPRRAEDYYIGQVTNGVLGGGYSARLNKEVRIKRGLSYGAASRLNAWRGAGIFGAACQTKNESAAEVVKVIRTELQRLTDEAVPQEEFTARRLVLTGGFQRELETNDGYVKRIADFITHGEPANSFAKALERMNAVTPAQVKEFATRQFAADSTSVIVVGRAKACEKPLRELFPSLRVIPQAKVDLDSPTLVSTSGKSGKR